EGVLALGLAHLIMAEKLLPVPPASSAVRPLAGWNEGLADYSPQRVEEITGVPAVRLARLARRFVEGSPAVAIAGGPALAHTNGIFTALAVNALNTLAGNIDRQGGISFTPQFDVAAAVKAPAPGTPPAAALAQWSAALASGSMAEVLFVDGVNPVFTAPPAWRVRDGLDKVPYIVSFGSFLDETSVMADLILPDHSFLEAWTEAVPESGAQTAVVSVAPAVMRPLYDTRATPDVLLDIARRLQRPLELPWQSFEEMLAASFGALPPATPDVDAWTDAQGKGLWSGTLPAALARQSAAAVNAPAAAQAYEAPRFDGEASEYPFHFLPYPSTTFFDGSLAHLPWLQEMPDPMTSAMWSSWIEINPSTAVKLGLGEGDVVEIASTQAAIRSSVVITPGIAPDVVAMPVGQGHRFFTRYASGRGANPMEIVAPLTEPVTGALAWAATRVRVSRVGPPDGRLILFAGGMREHVEQER
ncbi:MAG: molybdopterin dinucleotide binding domain-containing protein, partial [Vicinamibacterales bacterium]